jgi:pimeloyl-ACP methyl ester carboxylesterase
LFAAEPRCGISPWMHEPHSLSSLAENLGDWLVARGEQPVVVVGHSLGGVMALILAEYFQARVLGVIDVEGNICSEDCSLSGKAASQPLDHFLESGFEAMADEIYQLAHGEEQLQDFYASMRMCDPRAFHRHSAELVVLSSSEKLADRLGALPVPAFYIAGSPGGAGDRSQGLLEKAGVPCTVISKAGHVPFADQPDDFAKVVATMSVAVCKGKEP